MSSNPERVTKNVDLTKLKDSLGAVTSFTDGLLVNTGVNYPNGNPVFIALVMSNGKLRVSDYRKGLENAIQRRPIRTKYPGWFLGKTARQNGVRYASGEVYQLLPKNPPIRSLIDAIRSVATATQNGVLLTPVKG